MEPNYRHISITPMGKPRMTRGDRTNYRGVTQRYWKYITALRIIAPKNIDWERLTITFVLPMPKSWSRKKRGEMINKPHKQTPDLDNMIKAVKDGLLKEDSHIWRYGEMKKIWGEEGVILIKTKSACE